MDEGSLKFEYYEGANVPSYEVIENILESAERDNVPFKSRKCVGGCYTESCSCFEQSLTNQADKGYTACRIIAISDNEAVGAIAYSKTKNMSEKKLGNIDFVYVKSDKREKGIGSLLMQHAIGDLKDYGAKGVSVVINDLGSAEHKEPNIPMRKLAKKFLKTDLPLEDKQKWKLRSAEII